MTKHRISEMSWREVRAALASQPVVLIPLGSTEQHGPVSPTGDYLITDEITVRVAKRTDSLVAPVIPFGNSEYFRSFPGTISVRSETLASMWLHQRPELVDLKANEPGGRADFYGLTINDLSVATFERTPVAVYFDMEEISPNGSMVTPTSPPPTRGAPSSKRSWMGAWRSLERFKQMNVRPLAGPHTLSD